MFEFDCDWTDPGVCVVTKGMGWISNYFMSDRLFFQNKMFSALQDEGWEENGLLTEGWT